MSLFSSLTASSSAMDAFQRSLEVTQNNVDNASTPGYARQVMTLQASPFQPLQGLAGGVTTGEVQSSRDRFADAEVLRKQESSAFYTQQSTSLSAIENTFNVSGQSGIANALDNLYQDFSAWSTSPDSASARQSVLDGATQVAQAFNDAAATLQSQASDNTQQVRDTTKSINDLASQLRDDNAQRLRNPSPDAGLDAQTQNTLEQLGQLADITTLQQPDGTVTVLLGGQTPLVIGDHQYDLSVSTSTGNSAQILNSSGADITSQISQGKLGALLDIQNRVLPSYLGDATHPGDLNRLAQSVADRINQLLTAGQTADGKSGTALFTYNSSNNAAGTLAVNPQITGAQLAAVDPGPPSVANGTALNLSNLATSTDAADQIDGYSFVQFYGSLASRIGTELSAAQNNQDSETQLLTQAQSLRSQISGVSLDQEAVNLIEFQRAYQASAKMITTLAEMTQTAIDMVQ